MQTHHPKLGEFIPVLKQRLSDDAKLPAKQRLTARRHFERLRTEGYQGAYCAVASFIRQFKEQYQPAPHVVFIPQRFSAADAYQFDWSFETVKLNGLLVKLKIAHFRLCHSRAFFIRAYRIEQPVTAGIHLKILTDVEAGTLQDKITPGIDNRVIADINTRQRPQYVLGALNSTIITAELFTAGAQYHIAATVQLQVIVMKEPLLKLTV
ncbi:transposase [Yersinia thracica]|uniref:Transposase n=1 Tax=Yersinia thracica TaxID=2890319 RepID=A0A0T9QLY2_9GAMM|nr:transposase [Yersinia thracica]